MTLNPSKMVSVGFGLNLTDVLQKDVQTVVLKFGDVVNLWTGKMTSFLYDIIWDQPTLYLQKLTIFDYYFKKIIM